QRHLWDPRVVRRGRLRSVHRSRRGHARQRRPRLPRSPHGDGTHRRLPTPHRPRHRRGQSHPRFAESDRDACGGTGGVGVWTADYLKRLTAYDLRLTSTRFKVITALGPDGITIEIEVIRALADPGSRFVFKRSRFVRLSVAQTFRARRAVDWEPQPRAEAVPRLARLMGTVPPS